MSLSEIADKMGYSSVAHLSTQFKKTIGLTPTQFKAQGFHLRKTIDKV
jgi:AraC family transcriptional regulator